MLASTFFRKSSKQQEQVDIEREVEKAAESLSRLSQIAQLRSNAYHCQTEKIIENAIRNLDVLQQRLARHNELVDLVQVLETEILKKEEEQKKRESELEQLIVETNMQRVTLLTQRDEIANQLAITKRRLQEQQLESNARTHQSEALRTEDRYSRIAKLRQGDWDDALDIDDDDVAA
ncbi:unnamed protein product [Agarophyton chilense]